MFENIYVTIGFVTVLMLLDYLLTLWSFESYKKKFHSFVETENFELNPVFKKKIATGKYSVRHAISIALVAFVLFALYHYAYSDCCDLIDPEMFIMAQGMIISAFLYIITRHIRNLLIFASVWKKPSILKGKLRQSNEFLLKTSLIDAFGLTLLLFVLLIFQPSYFMLGFASGPLIVMLAHIYWYKENK